MRRLGRRATTVLQHLGAFALAVLKGFRANQGVLLAGAVAYYTLLSLVPLLILSLMVLSHLFSEDQLLLTLREYLEFVVPGQSSALVQELRTFLAHREVVGGFLLVTMLFFSPARSWASWWPCSTRICFTRSRAGPMCRGP